MEFDSAIAQYYDRARYYDSMTGRFISQDPIQFAARDKNLYRYVFNSSPNYTDHSGLMPQGQEDSTQTKLKAAQEKLKAAINAQQAIKKAMEEMERLTKFMSEKQKQAFAKLKGMRNRIIVQNTETAETVGRGNKMIVIIPIKLTVDPNLLQITLMHESWHVLVDSEMNSLLEELDAYKWELEWYATMRSNSSYRNKKYDDRITNFDSKKYLTDYMKVKDLPDGIGNYNPPFKPTPPGKLPAAPPLKKPGS